MVRFVQLSVSLLAVVALLVLATSSLAQQPRIVAGQALAQGSGGAVRAMRPAVPMVPGFYALRSEAAQKEIDLTDEQKEKLKKLGEEYQEEMKSARGDWSNWRELSNEERQAKSAEYREKYTKLNEKIRKQAEGILLPHQLDAMKMITLRQRGLWTLANANVLKQLEVTEEQKKKIEAIRASLAEKYQEIQKETFEEAFELLTPEQQKKLRDMSLRGFQGAYQRPATVQEKK